MRRRDVWFRKLIWSYVPIHWKGWLTVVLAFALTPIAAALGTAVSWAGYPGLKEGAAFAAMVVGFVILLVTMMLHAE